MKGGDQWRSISMSAKIIGMWRQHHRKTASRKPGVAALAGKQQRENCNISRKRAKNSGEWHGEKCRESGAPGKSSRRISEKPAAASLGSNIGENVGGRRMAAA
jgi:hypothetical protein